MAPAFTGSHKTGGVKLVVPYNRNSPALWGHDKNGVAAHPRETHLRIDRNNRARREFKIESRVWRRGRILMNFRGDDVRSRH